MDHGIGIRLMWIQSPLTYLLAIWPWENYLTCLNSIIYLICEMGIITLPYLKDCWENYMSYFVCVCVVSHFSHGQLFVTLWTVACQALLFMGFSRQEHWSWLQCPPPGDLPYLGIKCASHMSPALAGRVFTSNDCHQF